MTYSLDELKRLVSIGVIFLGVYRGRQQKTLFFDGKPWPFEEVKKVTVNFASDYDLDKLPLDVTCYVIEGMCPGNRSYSITVYDTHGQKLIYLEEPPRQTCHS